MKKYMYMMISAMLIAFSAGCSKDTNEFSIVPANPDNVLHIQSDNGKTSTGLVYKRDGSIYKSIECHYDNDSTVVYHMTFSAYIKGSDVFTVLNVSFESNQPVSFSDLKTGDTFDSSQFHVAAAYYVTGEEALFITTRALSGSVTVVGFRSDGDHKYMALKLTDLCFNAIDNSCVYTVNGLVEYEYWDVHYE